MLAGARQTWLHDTRACTRLPSRVGGVQRSDAALCPLLCVPHSAGRVCCHCCHCCAYGSRACGRLPPASPLLPSFLPSSCLVLPPHLPRRSHLLHASCSSHTATPPACQDSGQQPSQRGQVCARHPPALGGSQACRHHPLQCAEGSRAEGAGAGAGQHTCSSSSWLRG